MRHINAWACKRWISASHAYRDCNRKLLCPQGHHLKVNQPHQTYGISPMVYKRHGEPSSYSAQSQKSCVQRLVLLCLLSAHGKGIPPPHSRLCQADCLISGFLSSWILADHSDECGSGKSASPRMATRLSIACTAVITPPVWRQRPDSSVHTR